MRRGSLYIAVLGVATFVAVVGLSALAAVRIQQRVASLNEAAAQADFYAQSATDLTMFWIAADANWRTTYANDTWTTERSDGPVRFNFKLVDELDGNLANDPTQPVRLYGRATAGDAVRMYSVQLQPRTITNLLSNAEMENGTANWVGMSCTVESRTDTPHGGAKYIYVRGRTKATGGPVQIVSATVENGATYQFELWIAGSSKTITALPAMQITASGSGTQVIAGTSTSVGTAWTKITSSFSVTWSGTLTEADVGVSASNGTDDFKIDDALLGKPLTGPPLAPVRGTWRREVSTRQVLDQGETGGTALP